MELEGTPRMMTERKGGSSLATEVHRADPGRHAIEEPWCWSEQIKGWRGGCGSKPRDSILVGR